MRYSSALAVSVTLLPNSVVSQGYTNQSEVPLYGLSPPVYPSRKHFGHFRMIPANSKQLSVMEQPHLPGHLHMLVPEMLLLS
jgi:hypothetical protein